MSSHLLLVTPKFAHNVGGALRAASAFGAASVWYTGDRIGPKPSKKGTRLPREERMKGYADVMLQNGEYPFDAFPDVTPVCVEVEPSAEQLHHFEHPEHALYVFGPEDGSVPSVVRRHCHRFVMIPTQHCTNLAAAAYIVLYDRRAKRLLAGLEEEVATAKLLAEPRGWFEHEEVMIP